MRIGDRQCGGLGRGRDRAAAGDRARASRARIHVLDFLVCLTLMVAVRAAVKVLLERRRTEPAKATRRASDLWRREGRSRHAGRDSGSRADGLPGGRVSGRRSAPSAPCAFMACGCWAGAPSFLRWSGSTASTEVLLALPAASGDQIAAILEQCRAAGVSRQARSGAARTDRTARAGGQIREVRLEDLLGRPPAALEESGLQEHLAGRVVLVTGAGGSIGSELCRQIARYHPASAGRVRSGRDRAVSDRAGAAGAVSRARVSPGGGQHPEPAAPGRVVSRSTVRSRCITPPRTSTCR